MGKTADPNRIIPYSLRWPAWLSERVAEAANGRAQSMADWLRQAAIEKLNREEGES